MATPNATAPPAGLDPSMAPPPGFDPNVPMPSFDIPTPFEIHMVSVMGLTLASIALVWTVARLWIRRKAYWWDDLCSGLACSFLLVQVILLVYNNEQPILPAGVRVPYKAALNYLNAFTFLLQDWFARSALLYSIIRITPSFAARKILHWFFPVFMVLCAINISIFLAHCEQHDDWKYSAFALCIVPKSIPIYQMVTGIISDSILIILPINTLRMLSSAPAMRRRLMVIFSASVLLTIATIVQATLTFKEPGMKTLKASLVEGFVAVMVSSLAVIAIAVMQLLGINAGNETSRPSVKPASQVMKFQPNSKAKVDFRKSYTITDLKDSDTILMGTTTRYTSTLNDTATHGTKVSDQNTIVETVPGDEKEYEMESRDSNAGRDVERGSQPDDQSNERSRFFWRWRNLNVDEGMGDQVRTWAGPGH